MKAILLINMGGSESEAEVKQFLREMFLDRNILPYPLPFRAFLSWVITRKRTQKAWQRYQDMDGVDIKTSALEYCSKLSDSLGSEYIVDAAFLYSNESPLIKLRELIKKGATEIEVISLFPHPCICTNGKVRENIATVAKQNPNVSISFTENLWHYAGFNEMWTTLIQNHIAENNLNKPFLLFTAHSIPQSFADKGDCYQEYVIESARSIADELGLEFDVGFQSRLGKAQWLSLETQELLHIYKDEKEVVMIPISFVSENLETKFDIDTEFLPFARQELSMKNITRVAIPPFSEQLYNALLEAVTHHD